MWRFKARALLLRSIRQWRIPQVPPQAPILVPPSISSNTPWQSLPASSHLPYLRSFSSSPETVTHEDDSRNHSLNQELNESSGSESAGGESLSDLWEEVVQTDDSQTLFEPVDSEVEFDVDEEVKNVKNAIDSPGGVERCFSKMWYGINEEVVSRVLQESSNISPEKLLEFFGVIYEMHPSSVTGKTVGLFVNAIISLDEVFEMDINKLLDFIKKLGSEGEKGLVSIEALNGLLSVLSKLKNGKAALEVFEKFSDFSCVHDGDSYYFTIVALGKIKEVECAWTVCEKMLDSGNLPDGEKISEVISILCKDKRAKEAHLVYLMAKEKKLTVGTSVLDVLVGALSRRDETVKAALEMLDEYKGDALGNAGYIFGSVVQGLCKAKEMKEAKKLLLRMVESAPKPGNAAFNNVITALSKEGDMDEAVELMKLMVDTGLRPDVYTYTVIMSAYAKYDMMKEAHDLLHEAKERHEKLYPVCYHTIIRGYCKREQFDKAIECLHEMKEGGVTPNLDEYNQLIQSLCLKAIDWRSAEALLAEMENSGLRLNGLNSITRSLISAVKELEEEEVKSNASIEA
ncbi:tetratricopeptide repeat (TPR)-like superfamily protein [Carex rostrata]